MLRDLGPVRRTLAALITTIALLGSGCTSSEPDGATSSAAPADVDAPVWTLDIGAIGQPVITADTAVVISRARDDELDIVGVDVANGEERWRYPYSPGYIPAGYELAPVVATGGRGRELVVFQSPEREPEAFAPMLAVDPATGDVVHRTDRVLAHEPLGSCADGRDVCTTLLRSSGDPDRRWRWDLSTGSLTRRGDGDTGGRPRDRSARALLHRCASRRADRAT